MQMFFIKVNLFIVSISTHFQIVFTYECVYANIYITVYVYNDQT